MADSNITKQALAAALKGQMEAKPFSKISVGDICAACGMNRKSFYYHFKDKYDLVNWVFYTEFILPAFGRDRERGWAVLGRLCQYLYENQGFYRKILALEGQNSFGEYFRDIISPAIQEDVERLFGRGEANDFYVDFYLDAFLAAIKRWLLAKSPMPAEVFVFHLRRCLAGLSQRAAENPG